MESLSKDYISQELSPILLAAQLIGSDPELMAARAREMRKRGAIANPFIFHEIRSYLTGTPYKKDEKALLTSFATYQANIPVGTTPRTSVRSITNITCAKLFNGF